MESSDQSDHRDVIAPVSHVGRAARQCAMPARSVTPTITKQIAITISST
jgi:hypothetical protein